MRTLRTVLVLAICFLINFEGFSQPSEVTYKGTVIKSGYTVDESFGPYNIGFNFTFYGKSYNQFYVNTNGLVLFVEGPTPGAGLTDGTEDPIPSTEDPNNFIAAFWDQLAISASGKLLYGTAGVAPYRKLIIQSANMSITPGPLFFGTFQVILYETTNKIQVQFRTISDATSLRAHGSSAAIGIENSDGTMGVQYSYQNSTAVNTGTAISFIPSGPSYTMDPDAIYDGVVLTSNINLPEPGIPLLVSPSQDAIIGSDHTFRWSESSDATSYTLLISRFSDLGGASVYNAGSNLSFDVTGLNLNTTYYWGVIAKNATGETWCEIKKFRTSATPPLAAVPGTVWLEQSQDKVITLNHTGGDAGPKTAIITSLPAQGSLYQCSGGIKSSSITTVPATVTDPENRVIYTANGGTGNRAGNFNFKMNDGTGDSPEATITVNVSPPGIPSVLYVAKSSNIEIQFDRIMADPAGKHEQFTAIVNLAPRAISSASLKEGDPYTIVLALSPALTGTEAVTIAYTAGNVTSSLGGFLLSFDAIPVTLRAQTINFTQSLDKKFNESPFNLTATASSGLGLTYSNSNINVATLTGSQVTLRFTGTSAITARQAGNATWAPARYVKTMTVSKGDQTITFNPLPEKTYGDAGFSLTATAGSGQTVSYSSSNTAVATITGSALNIIGAGSTVITASQAGNSVWNPAPDVQQTLTVNKAPATVTLSELNHVYDGSPHQATVITSPEGLPVNITYDGGADVPVNAGSYSVIATVDDPNYEGTATGSLVIAKAELTVAADNKTRAYGEANPVFTFSYSGFVNDEDETVLDTPPSASTTAVGTTAPGTVPITLSGGADNNYEFSYTDGELTITKATTTITPANVSAVYNGLPHEASATTVPAGLTVSFTYNGSDQPPVDAGSYSVTATVDDPNYEGTANSTLEISKAALTVTADNKTRAYGEANPVFTISYSGFLNGEDETVLDTRPSAVSSADITTVPGTALITVSGGTDNNYDFSYTDGELTITKATATVVPANLSATYNGLPHEASATTIPAGLTVSFTYNGSDQPPVSAGSYSVTATVDDLLYEGTANGTLVISKALLTATADNKTRAYGEANPVFTISYSGFVNGEDETVLDTRPLASTTAGETTAPGTAPVTVSGGADNNYEFSYTDGELTITKFTASVIPVNLSATYDGLPHGASATTIPSGLTVTITYNGSEQPPSDAGSYSVLATVDDPVYEGSATGSLVIEKAPLTFRADNKTREYMAPNPALTRTVTGFIGNDTEADLDVLPAIQTAATADSPAGMYPITLSGGNDNNYTFTYINGTLTVTKTGQTITITGVPGRLLTGDTYMLEAESSSGEEVLFESSDETVGKVTGNQLTGVTKGMVQIRAYNAGDNNYEPAEAFATVEVYSTHRDIMNLFTPNNDGINDYWELPDRGSWSKCDVKVYNRWGKLVFADPDYNNLWDGTSNGAPLPEGAYYFIIDTGAGVVKGTVNIVR